MKLREADSAGLQKSHSHKVETIAAWIAMGLMYLILGISLFLIWQKAQ